MAEDTYVDVPHEENSGAVPSQQTEAQEEEDSKIVFVTNISPAANETTVSDFFSFCGKIHKLVLRKTPSSSEGAQEAIVEFYTDAAAKTALLLTNALIVDRPIAVSALPHATAGTIPETATVPESAQKQHPVPDHERTKTSVIASMIAAGYSVGSDAIGKARQFDEKHSISLRLQAGAEMVKAKAHSIDKKLHISETAAAVGTAIETKAKQINEKLHITEKAQAAKTAVSETVHSVMEKPTIKAGIGKIKAAGEKVSNKAKEVGAQTRDLIAKKKEEKAVGDEASAAPGAEAPVEEVSESSAEVSGAQPAETAAEEPVATAAEAAEAAH